MHVLTFDLCRSMSPRCYSIAFSIFMMLGLAVSAQNTEKINNLTSKAQKSQHSERYHTLNALGWEYRKFQPDSTLYFCQKALDEAKANGTKNTVATSLNFMGVAYFYKGDYSNAFRYYTKAHGFAKENDDLAQYAHAFNNIGRLYFIQGDLVQSYEHYFHALRIFKDIKDNDGMAHAYKSLGNLFKTEKNYDKALEMLGLANSIREQNGGGSSRISILSEMAETHKLKSNYQKSKEYLHIAEEVAKNTGDSISMAKIKLGLSSLYFDTSVYQQALRSAQEALRTINKTKNKDMLSRAYFQLGKVNFKLKDFASAKSCFSRTIQLTEKSGMLERQFGAYLYLSNIYKKEGNLNRSFINFKNYTYLKDSAEHMDKVRTIELLTARVDVEKISSEFEALKSKELQDQQTIRYERAKNLTQTMALLLALSLFITLYLAFRRRVATSKALESKNQQIEQQSQEISTQNKRIQAQNQKLQKRNDTLADLNDEKDNLMHLVAHDLKSPFNKLLGLLDLVGMTGPLNNEQSELTQLSKNTARAGVSLITDLLDATAFEVSQRLHVSTIEACGFLDERIIEFSTESASKGIRISNESDKKVYFDTDRESLTRIIDNLISNAIKYGNLNTDIRLSSFEQHEHIVGISIKDQGPGFSREDKKNLYKKFQRLSAKPTAGESSNGLGLAIVKTLADRLHCTIELISESGQGSEFILYFPKTILQGPPVSLPEIVHE